MSVSTPVIDYIDPAARRIYLLAGVTEYHPLDDIYAEVRYLRRTDETLRKYFMFIEGGGNIPKNAIGTLRTPRYAIFKNCKVVVSDDTYVSGEQLYADANGDVVGKGPDAIDHALSPEDAYIDYEPPGSEVIQVGSGLTEAESERLKKAAAMVGNRQEIASNGTMVTYDDDGVTPLYTHDIRDVAGNDVEIGVGTPAKRSAAS